MSQDHVSVPWFLVMRAWRFLAVESASFCLRESEVMGADEGVMGADAGALRCCLPTGSCQDARLLCAYRSRGGGGGGGGVRQIGTRDLNRDGRAEPR